MTWGLILNSHFHHLEAKVISITSIMVLCNAEGAGVRYHGGPSSFHPSQAEGCGSPGLQSEGKSQGEGQGQGLGKG